MMKRLKGPLQLALALGVAFVAHAVPATVPAGSFNTPIDASAVKALLAARDTATLDAAFAHCDTRDVALVAVYRRRRLELEPTADEERRFIEGLPKTTAELLRVYALVDTPGLAADERINETVYGMFQAAAEVIAKLGTGHRRLIQLCYLTDGELGESAWPAYDWLLKNDPSRTLAALRSMPLDVRTQICGIDPVRLPDDEAVTRCRSGL